MHRLRWGDSLVKLTRPRRMPAAANPQCGHLHATGLRYMTLWYRISTLCCHALRAGRVSDHCPAHLGASRVEVTFVSDLDGNAVEFLQA
jgi:hypothetical protein